MEFAINLLLTWVIGLSIPTLVRYVFIKRALSTRAAIWVAVANSVSLWILFTTLSIIAGSRDPSHGFAWVIVYFVAKAILETGSESTNQKTTKSAKNGHGKEILPDGTKYIGEFRDGLPHGQGTKISPNGKKYIGEWIEDQRFGHGTETLPDGTVYTGEWENDMKCGQGIFVLPNGYKYEGDFKSNKPHGRGTITRSDGSKKLGNWFDGKYVGL